MQAYAILDGGGVKGAALAGCLAAAEACGVKFVGYGGTSAGSIIALLASVGYDGVAIRNMLKNEVQAKGLLDDDGISWFKVRDYPEKFLEIIGSNSWPVTKCWQLRTFASEISKDLVPIVKEGGLYNGSKMKEKLLKLVQEKLKAKGLNLEHQHDVFFEDLTKAKCPSLKIVASDISSRKAVIYSEEDKKYGVSVIEAVRASACYPFLFKPVNPPSNVQLIDGGIASNLPVFLFSKEQQTTHFPILAFDLVSGEEVRSDSPLIRLSKGLLSTALEASDSLMVELIPGVKYVPVTIPKGIDALKFDLSPQEIDSLYAAGYEATTEFLKDFGFLLQSTLAGNELIKQLQVRYGDQKLFEPVLWGVRKMIEERTGAKNTRAQIMFSTGRHNGSRIVVYHNGFRNSDTDKNLELQEHGGCTGYSIKHRLPIVADLDLAKNDPERWGMAQEEQNLVAADRKSMISIPIFAHQKFSGGVIKDLPVLGVLSIDSDTPVADTKWVIGEWSASSPEANIDGEIVDIMKEWATIVGQLLRSQNY